VHAEHVTLEEIRQLEGDEFGRVLTLNQAAATVGVTTRTIRRWIANNQLRTLPDGLHVIERHAMECERDRHIASHQGRPGPRLPVSA
jgi:excisionase family DNA binding protein